MKVGKRAAKQIIKEREVNGDFKGLFDFVKRVVDKGIKSNAVKNLILAGAFDDFGYRKVLYDRVDELFILVRNTDNVAEIDNELANASADIHKEFDKLTLMQLERDMLGINISGDPLKYIIHNYNGYLSEEQLLEHLGIITAVKTTKTRKGDLMAFATIRKSDGIELRVVIFPKVYNKSIRILERGKIVYFDGYSDSGGFIAKSIIDASDIIDNTDKNVKVTFKSIEELLYNMDSLQKNIKDIIINTGDRTIEIVRLTK